MFENSETSPYRVCVLGNIAVRDGSNTAVLKPQLRKALAVLVAAGTAGASAERLANEIWTGEPPKSWEASLRNAMADLRARLGGSGVSNITRHYTLALPTSEVDLWHFWALAADKDHDWTQPATMALLSQSTAFPDLDLSTDLATAAQQHRDTRREILHRLISGSTTPLTPPILRILRSETVRDPYDGWIPYTAALAHARAGDTKGALEIIDLVEGETLKGLSSALPSEFEDLRSDLVTGRYDITLPRHGLATTLQSSLPAGLALSRRQSVGRERDSLIRDTLSALAELNHKVCLVLVSGPQGVGKTRFISGLAGILHERGHEVVAGVSPPSDVAYGTFLTAFPELRETFASGGQLDPTERGYALSKAAEAIESTAPDRPLVIALDDGHLLDSPSQQLLETLLLVSTKRSVTFLVAGQADTDSTMWAEFSTRSRKLAATISVTLGPLSAEDVNELVAQTYPDAPSTARVHLVREILSKSGGLPTIANALVAAIDPFSFSLDHHEARFPYSFSQEISQLSPNSRTILVAAAVLGGGFSLESASVLTGSPVDVLRRSVIELLSSGLIVDTTMIDEYRLTNGLVGDAILNQTPEPLVRQLHIRARGLAVDEHQLARHSYAANPALGDDEVAGHLISSGRSYAERGAAREAAQEFRRAEKILTDDFPIGHAATFAAVLDLSGAPFEASTMRARTVSRAQSLSLEGVALEAALAGLPEAERTNGDTDRVELLLRIRTELLGDEQRFQHATSLARQLTLLGRMLSASHWAGVSIKLAKTADQHAEAAYVSWFTRLQTDHPADRLRHCAGIVADDVSDKWRTIVEETVAIDRFELGDLGGARAALAGMESHARKNSDPLRIWHCELLRATDSFATGDWATARERSHTALATGLRHGIATATAVSVAQGFAESLLTGSTTKLLDTWDLAPPEIRTSDLALAGYASALLKAGEQHRSTTIGEPLLARILDRPNINVLPIVATLADLFAVVGDKELTSAAVKVLGRRSGSALLVGAGVSTLGPADRYLSKITGELSLLGDAIDFADETGLTTWSVALRHELATLTGEQRWRDQAARLTDGTTIGEIRL